MRLDPALGLFGLIVSHPRGFLADPANREAIAMAIDRDGLIEPFNVGGWSPTTRLVAPGLEGDPGSIGERWQEMNLAQRRRIAAQRVASWSGGKPGKRPEISIDLPEGPGSDILFTHLERDLKSIGLVLRRAKKGEQADLDLVDRVARYSGPRWFLDQFNCGLQLGVCSSAADKLVAQAIETEDQEQSAALLTQAEQELTKANGYIPFGPPVRFSLVRAGIDGFAANRWVFHPLPQLAVIPR